MVSHSSRPLRTRAGQSPESVLNRPIFWAASTLTLSALAIAVTVASNDSAAPASIAANAPSMDTATFSQPPVNNWSSPSPVLDEANPAGLATATPFISSDVVEPANDEFASEHFMDESEENYFTVTSEQEAHYEALNTNAAYPDLNTRMMEMHARRDGRSFDPASVLAALASNSPWAANDSIAAKLDLSDEERFDGREFVTVDQMRIESLVPGDTIELPVAFESGTLQMEVQRVEVGTAGDVTWHGRISGLEDENQVSITQGDVITIGGITTPNGVYMIESRADAGWIVPTGTLFKISEEEHDDGILPPESAHS